jgi:glucose uptake protein GlcU
MYIYSHMKCCSALWVPANLFAILAIKSLGIGVAQGLWSGCIVLTSFLWGAVFFGDPIKNIWLTLLGLLLLTVGILGLALCPTNSAPDEQDKNIEESATDALDGNIVENEQEVNDKYEVELTPSSTEFDNGITFQNVNNGAENVGTSPSSEDKTEKNPITLDTVPPDSYYENSPKSWKKRLMDSKVYISGVIFCVMVGLLGGSQFVPTKLGPDLGIVYIVSFGIGNMIVTPIVFVGYYLVRSGIERKPVLPQFHFKQVLLPGLLSGALWNIGNYCGTNVVLSFLGLTVGYPLCQIALLVAGLNGILIFREITSVRGIAQFIVSSLVFLLPGCALLAFFGKD